MASQITVTKISLQVAREGAFFYDLFEYDLHRLVKSFENKLFEKKEQLHWPTDHSMRNFSVTVLAFVLGIESVQCYLNSMLMRRRHMQPLHAGPAMTSWSYKTVPEDFIVIEDRVLESYGQNFTTQSTITSDPNAPDVAQLELAEVLGEEQLNKLITLSKASQSSWSGLESITLKIFPALSKEERTKFHQNVRKIYPTVDSKTELKEANEEQRKTTYILIYPKGAKSLVNPNDAANADYYDDNRRGGKKKVVVQRWDRNKPDYLHFTVIKSMLSTSEMMDKLAKATSMLPTRFEFCGSKDKRALTYQRVSSWRVDQDVIARVSTDSMIVRDVCVASAPLHLGDLSGNFFAITLRKEKQGNTLNSLNILEHLSAQEMLSSFAEEASHPFMNVFGVQRFGSPLPSNPEVGKRLLTSDYKGAVLMLLLAPSTAAELAAGGLDIVQLNHWLNSAQNIETKNLQPNTVRSSTGSAQYFESISGRLEEYKSRLELAIANGQFDDDGGKASEDEKMGDEWSAMMADGENSDDRKRDRRDENEGSDRGFHDDSMRVTDDYDVGDDDESSLDDLYSSSPRPLSTSSSTSSTSQVTGVIEKTKMKSQKQLNAIRDLQERLQCLSDLLKGRPFRIPKSASFLQKKILGQLYDEMAKKCEGDLSRVNFSRVFSVLPQALRQLFVNSYQSLVWNDIAAERFQNNKHNGVRLLSDENENKDTENYKKLSVIELKTILKENSLKVSGKKDELIARLIIFNTEKNSDNSDSINDSNSEKDRNKGNSVNGKGNSMERFLTSDTAVVGDIVLVDLLKTPLTAWHVAARNITLNGNHIPLWSVDAGSPKIIAAAPVAITSNTPYNMNPNSPFYAAKINLDNSGGRNDRDRGRGGRGERDRGRRGSEEEVDSDSSEEVREVRACYHIVTSEDEKSRLYPVESIIVALPGASAFCPPGGSMVSRLVSDKMEVLLSGTHQDKIFRLPGAYRHLVTIAKNVRLAAVHTSSSQVTRVSDDVVETNSIDEDIVYDDWSYSRQGEKKSSTESRQHTQLDGNSQPAQTVTVERPVWRKIDPQRHPSLPLSPTQSLSQTGTEKEALGGEYPFSAEVEKMWESDIIPKMLHDIYSECSTPAHVKNIALLPTSVTRTIQPSASTSSEQEQVMGTVPTEGSDVEGLRISFSLCASTYATTLLDHLVDTVNKKHAAQR